jgi:anti-sigma B factor antagonist
LNIEVKTENKNKAVVVYIRGEVDLYSSPEVRKIIISLTKQKSPAIIIDLAKVTYMDSSGIATLVEGLQQTGKYKGKFAVVGLRSGVKEVFELSRLDKVFDIYENEEQALDEIR